MRCTPAENGSPPAGRPVRPAGPVCSATAALNTLKQTQRRKLCVQGPALTAAATLPAVQAHHVDQAQLQAVSLKRRAMANAAPSEPRRQAQAPLCEGAAPRHGCALGARDGARRQLGRPGVRHVQDQHVFEAAVRVDVYRVAHRGRLEARYGRHRLALPPRVPSAYISGFAAQRAVPPEQPTLTLPRLRGAQHGGADEACEARERLAAGALLDAAPATGPAAARRPPPGAGPAAAGPAAGPRRPGPAPVGPRLCQARTSALRVVAGTLTCGSTCRHAQVARSSAHRSARIAPPSRLCPGSQPAATTSCRPPRPRRPPGAPAAPRNARHALRRSCLMGVT